MKFNCGPTWREKIDAKEVWHDWFAWHPVRLGTTHDCRWLETIQRKGKFVCYWHDSYWDWEYKA